MLTKVPEENDILSCLELLDKPFEEVTSAELVTAIRDIKDKMSGLHGLLDKLTVVPEDERH